MAADRRAAEARGRRAETLAALLLSAKGVQILAGGEIDIAAKRGQLLIFAEVKARANADDAILAVTPAARRRIEAAGRSFISTRPHLADYALRYDIIAVAGWRPRHFPDAWREGDWG